MLIPSWLIERFKQLPLPDQQKAELYESLRVPLRWNLKNSTIARTRNWQAVRNMFYHTEPDGTGLISRSQVSLGAELARRPPQLTKLSRKQGDEVMDMIREVMLVRYRELYGTTLGDPASVVRYELRADLGTHEAARGVTIYLWNLPPNRRLPLRAYVAGLTLKNGVPINYIEAIGLCEWMEVGFNTFYTFRGGEAGWIYAQVLRCLCHRMGTTCVSVYPYQLGHDNEEAIESGAFWFYRKLGFRPGRADLQKLAEREEAENRRRSQIPDTPAHAEAAGIGSRLLRVAGKRSGGLGHVFDAQHRLARESPDGARLWRRCHPHARAREACARANPESQHVSVDAIAEGSLRQSRARSSRCARIACMVTRRKRRPRPNHPRQSQTRRNALPTPYTAARAATEGATEVGVAGRLSPMARCGFIRCPVVSEFAPAARLSFPEPSSSPK